MSISSLVNTFNAPRSEIQLLTLRNILSKKPEERGSEDLDFVAKYIYNLKYFQSIVSKEEERLEFAKGCAKYLKYELHPQGSEVFRRGDKGQNFYIILDGEASVFLPKTEEEVEKDSKNEAKAHTYQKYTEFVTKAPTFSELPSETRLTPRRLTFNGRSRSLALNKAGEEVLSNYLTQVNSLSRLILSKESSILQEVKVDLTYEEKLLFLNNTKQETDPYFIRGTAIYKKVNSLKQGDYFGELALIFNQPRLASIIAGDDLHLLSLKSSSYKAVFESEIQNVLEKTKLFRGFFPIISQDDIGKFCYLLEEKSFKFNDVIYKEGDEAEALYIIQQGEVQLSKNSKADKGNPGRRGSITHRRIIAATLGNGNFFGDFETITKTKMKYTALCTSTTLVYKLAKRRYFGIIETHFPVIAQNLHDQALANEKHRQSRIEVSEKIQFAALSFDDFEDHNKQVDGAKEVETKLMNVYRRTSETIPLHMRLKHSIILRDEEDLHDNSNHSDKSDHKIQHLNSHPTVQSIFSSKEPRRSFMSTMISNGEISTPTASNKNKDTPLSFSRLMSPLSPSKKPQIMIPIGTESSESQSNPNTPNSFGTKFKLPNVNSQKSNFSGTPREKGSEELFVVQQKRKSSLFSMMKKDSEENTPVNVKNIISPRSDKDSEVFKLPFESRRRFQSIFASAFQSTPTSPRITLQSSRSEEKIHNIHIAAKVEQTRNSKQAKIKPLLAKTNNSGSITERRRSDIHKLQPLFSSYTNKPFETEVSLEIKQVKGLDSLCNITEFIIRKGVCGQSPKSERKKPHLVKVKHH